MSVAHDASSESATGDTGSASEASFTWSHAGASSGVKGVLVFTFVNANADNALSVTYGGVSLVAVTGGRAVDTQNETGDCKAWFLGSGVPQGTQDVIVNRTNNANVMYAVAITVLADTDTETFNPVLLQENRALAEQYVVDCGLTNSVRYAGVNSGLATHPPAGTNSTELHFFPASVGTRSISTVRETTAGSGARLVGFTASTDDVAFVGIAIREAVNQTPAFTCDLCLQGDTGHADGTTLTAAIYKGMGFSPDFPVTFDGSATGQTINADQSDRPKAAFTVRNCGIAAKNASYRSYRLDNSLASRSSNFDWSALNLTRATVFGYFKCTAADTPGNAGLYDVVRMSNSLSDAAIMQLDIRTGQAGIAMNIETIPGGSTTHSAYITLVAGRAYWFNIHSNLVTGVPKLSIWDLTTGELVDSVTSTQETSGTAGVIGDVELGNSEAGTASGAFTYLQVYADYTTFAFPIPPPTTQISGPFPTFRPDLL